MWPVSELDADCIPCQGMLGRFSQGGELKHSTGCGPREGSLCLSRLVGAGECGRPAGEPQGAAGPTYFTVTSEMCQALEAPHGSN